VERLVVLARQRRRVRGRRLRVDTTVVETPIHYPTDSTLLADGVGVLTRTLKRLQTAAPAGVVRLRDRTRSVARRVFALTQLSRQAKQEPVKLRMRTLYRELMGRTRAVVREAEAAGQQVAARTVRAAGRAQVAVQGLAQQQRETSGLVRQVLAQTQARVLRGNTRDPDKVLSLFEPHTEAICKALFGRAPRLAVADAGFASRANERAAHERGVHTVVLPGSAGKAARGPFEPP
jgi:IS5 family transposase